MKTFIEEIEIKNYQKDPEKFYIKVCGGMAEFDNCPEYENFIEGN